MWSSSTAPCKYRNLLFGRQINPIAAQVNILSVETTVVDAYLGRVSLFARSQSKWIRWQKHPALLTIPWGTLLILIKVNPDFNSPFPICSSSIRSLSAPAWWSRRETGSIQNREPHPSHRRRWRSGTCDSGAACILPRRWDTCPEPCGGRSGRLCRKRPP